MKQIIGLDRAANRAPRVAVTCIAIAGIALFGVPAGASERGQMAADYGCLNCHSGQARPTPSAAPSLKHLTDKMARKGDPPEAMRHMLHEMREKTFVHTHRMVSDETANAILQQVAQGAK